MESPVLTLRPPGTPVTTVVRNQTVSDIETEIETKLNAVKSELHRFLRSCHRYPTPQYLTTPSALFSAKMTISSIIVDAMRCLKTTLATIFFRSSRGPVERPMTSPWLIFHIADILAAEYRDFSHRNFFHVPTSTGYDVVYLDDHMLVNGRQTIYLCITPMQDENIEPSRIELFRRGHNLEDPDQEDVREMIIDYLYEVLINQTGTV